MLSSSQHDVVVWGKGEESSVVAEMGSEPKEAREGPAGRGRSGMETGEEQAVAQG